MGIGEPVLQTWEKLYSQEADTCSSEEFQDLRIEQDDGGGGPFWRIKTQEWSFDSIDGLVAVLKDAGVPQTAPESLPPPALVEKKAIA